MMKAKQIPPHRSVITDLQRLSHNGSGSVQWGLDTDFDLSEVLEPGFFHVFGKQGLMKNDRIFVVCRKHESTVTHATLVITGSRPGADVLVAQLGEAYEVEITSMTPFERLGVPTTANKHHIDVAYRERAKMLHPDKGGSKEAMATLTKARDEAMLIAESRAAA